jgi:hypothetical protein
MATIFISHSSKDADFARTLAKDLEGLGHVVWFDEYRIRVGDCIVSKIEDGISSADYVVVVLSPDSVRSEWVEREWKAKFWDEVKSGKTLVLPARIAQCEIPLLLRTKRYADFQGSYGIGLVQLTSSIDPLIKMGTSGGFPKDAGAEKISALLAKIQSRSVPLSQCIAEALPIAREAADTAFERFCRVELAGWKIERPTPYAGGLGYRELQTFISPFGEINAMYFGWGGDLSNALDHMRNDKEHFFPFKLVVTYPVSKLEADFAGHSPKGLLSTQLRQGDLLKHSDDPDRMVTAYCRPDAYGLILEGIRRELTEHLLKLLPEAVLE